ncbi:MAG TPA: DUF2703 domain-containing protein [Geobacteraceae bacterium]|nr:DUF2703 domain-containing protein [Geobacteraceae bacterium]
MRTLTIEWRHYAKAGKTCLRCSATGKTLVEVVADLRRDLEPRGITLSYLETKLPAEELAQSNMILFNGIPLEQVLEGAAAAESACHSCSCLTGTDAFCRTVEYEGRSYEEVPEKLIRKAAFTALELEQTC